MSRLTSYATAIKDSLLNLVTGLGTAKDPRTSTTYQYNWLDRNELEVLYRTDWLARRIIDAPAEDATREWRVWLTDKKQVSRIEKVEVALQIQRKLREALVRARLYGGAAIVLGVDQGRPQDELDLDAIAQDSLKFAVVLNRYELSAGPRIYDVDSPYYTRPEYYTVATPMFGFGRSGDRMSYSDPQGQSPPARSYSGNDQNRRESYASPGMIQIHPSRVVEFAGNELPDWRLAPLGGGWGDPVLQTVEDSLKDFGLIIGGLASMINDMKMDVVKVPDLSRKLSMDETSSKLLQRFTLANQAKSSINTLLLDKEEEWERIQTSFGTTDNLIQIAMQVACAAGGIPVSRAMGAAPSKGLSAKGGSGGEVDLRNYYDGIAADQRTKYKPRLMVLDRCLTCSALGEAGIDVDYDWNPLYKPTPEEEAAVAFQKAQATQVYVGTGLLNEDALRQALINQLVEDEVYPGLEDAIDEFGAEPDEPEPEPPPPEPPSGMLPKGQFEPNPFAMLRAQGSGRMPTGKFLPSDKPKIKSMDEIDPDDLAMLDPDEAEDLAEFFDDYDPNEPRDETGKWSAAGAAAAAAKKEGPFTHTTSTGEVLSSHKKAGPGGIIAKMLLHPEGATSDQMKAATGWGGVSVGVQAKAAGLEMSPVEKKWVGGKKTAIYKAKPASVAPAPASTPSPVPTQDPSLPPGHSFFQSGSGAWHVIPPGGAGSLGFGKTKAEAVYEAKTSAEGKTAFEKAGLVSASPQPIPTPVGGHVGLEEVVSWKKVGGQGGSNPGGVYQEPGTSATWYVKTPPSEDYARNEVLTGKLYALAGAKVPETKLVTLGGHVSVASRMLAGAKQLNEYSGNALADHVEDAKVDFAADAWLGNRDVVGLDKDNLLVDQEDGWTYRVDHGGGMAYRAQGQPKEFGPNADEFVTLRNPGINAQAASIFGDMSGGELQSSIAKVMSVSPAAIANAVASVYPVGSHWYSQYKDVLIARQNYLYNEGKKLGAADFDEVLAGSKSLPAPQEPTAAEKALLPADHDFGYSTNGNVLVLDPRGNSIGEGPTHAEALAMAGIVSREDAKAAKIAEMVAEQEKPSVATAALAKWNEASLPPGWTAKPSSGNPNATSFYEGTEYKGKIISSNGKWTVQSAGVGVSEHATKAEAVNAFVSSKYDPKAAAKKAEAAAMEAAKAKMTAAQKKAVEGEKLKKLAAMTSTPEQAVKSVAGYSDQAIAGAHQKAIASGFEITPIEAAAIQSYTGSAYGAINKALRKNELTEEQFLYAQALKSGLKKLKPYVGTVKRGTSLSDQEFEKYQVGKIKFEPGFTSTSVTKPWGGNAQFTIETSHGIHVKKLSLHSAEDEVLIPTHLPLKVISHDVIGGVHHIHMVEVGHSTGSLADGRRA